MAAWPPFNHDEAWTWTDRLIFVVCVAFLLFLLFGDFADASGPEQRQVKVTVVVPPHETNYWPAIIGALGALGAAGCGILYRRRP